MNYDFDLDGELECPACGRVAAAVDLMEVYSELSDFVCPCGRTIAIVPHATIEETKAAAAAGNPKALRELDFALGAEAFCERLERMKLKSAAELPELIGERLEFDWDFVADRTKDEHWTVIRCRGVVVWWEPAIYEGADRFDEIKALLKERYGSRFASLTPTEASKLYLHGDHLRSVSPY